MRVSPCNFDMRWTCTYVSSRFSLRFIALCISLLLISCVQLLLPSWKSEWRQRGYVLHSNAKLDGYGVEPPTDEAGPVLNLPAAHHYADETIASKCEAAFGVEYLRAFSRTATQYCEAGPAPGMTCFRNSVFGGKLDSFCFGGPAEVRAEDQWISSECALRQLTDMELTSGVPAIASLPQYFYDTGPRALLKDFVKLEMTQPIVHSSPKRPAKYSLLVKREANNDNVWHVMMEIMSLTMSLDILSISLDPSTGQPVYTATDRAKTQIVLLDDLANGQFYDLWRIDADLPTVRLSDITPSVSHLGQILLPLPGGINPLWSGDLQNLDCRQSALLAAFSKRVLDFYEIRAEEHESKRRLTMTYIDRSKKRRLLHKSEYIGRLQAQYPDINIVVVDFASLTFAEQLRVTQSTSILVGIHGAGLTHAMFLPPNSVVVEILPPKLPIKCYQNIAQLLSHTYFGIHGEVYESAELTGDWQQDDVMLGEEAFMELIGRAIGTAKASRERT